MNSSDFFITPLRNVDFLSIFNSISILSTIFFDDKLLSEDNPYKPVPIVNTLCEYLDKNNYSENASIDIVKKLLKNTHFYGGKENETLEIKYVDAELNNIVTSIVFSKFGNTFGYLSAIVNSTNNLILSFFKKKIFTDLGKQIYLNSDYTNSTLSESTVKHVTEKIIFPLFPNVPKDSDLKIIDVDYIYAQAGLMFTRTSHIYSANTTFEEFITISQSIEQGVRLGHLNKTALQIFQLPALLLYTHNNPEMFKNISYNIIVYDKYFWNLAFYDLFADLYKEHQNISSIQKNNPVYNFEKALFGYRNRSEYAEYIIKSMCPHTNETNYEEEVKNYKYDNDQYHCKADGFKLPNINELFDDQNHFVANLYSYVEKKYVEEAFSNDLLAYVNQKNVTVKPVEIKNSKSCGFRCQALVPQLRKDTILFETSIYSGERKIYALIQQDGNVTIHSEENNHDQFMETIGLNSHIQLVVEANTRAYKYPNETIDQLLNNLVKKRRDEFYNHLKTTNHDPTLGEWILGLLKNFIPFYTCAKAIKTETPIIAACACIVDSVVLIPVVGVMTQSGLKFFNAALRPLLVNFRNSLRSFSIGSFIGTTLRNFAVQTSSAFSGLINRELFRDIGVAILRTVDPGIEFAYAVGRAGIKSIIKCFKVIGRKIVALKGVIRSLNNVVLPSMRSVGNFFRNKLFVNSFTGSGGYGVKYYRLRSDTVELRRVQGYKNEVPVILMSDPDDSKKIYRILDVESGELTDTTWELNAKDILVVEKKPFTARIKTIETEGLSGRGLISNRLKMKIAWQNMQVEIFDDWHHFIDESFLSHVTSHYILDDVNVRNNLLRYLDEYKILPEWINDYEITNLKDYQLLRYDGLVQNVPLTEQGAVNRVRDLFKNKYRIENTLMDPYVMYEIYKNQKLDSIVNFDDYCSIGHYIMFGPERSLLQRPEGWLIQNAFNKVAMRYVDFPIYQGSKTFYKMNQVPLEMFETLKPGAIQEYANLHSFEKELSTSLEYLNTINRDITHVDVLYEIIIDNPMTVVDLEKLIPNVKPSAVGLPNTKYTIENVEYFHVIGEHIVYKVTMRNTPIDKSKFIAKLNKNIDTFNKQIASYNSIIDDFDIDLL
ncbi:uncharacterized protein LOC127289037 [Leptopilina boulardi]|uniref:uncharacterized protein LOC127289037 n=1 Tax=Leptopilina boulardi TaxID=63433 RepID=UPI0021F55E24|nr:uncharacterized protein LOC127289037 [Leptopilina boulardi]